MAHKKLFFYSNINRKDTSIGITKKVFSQIEVLKQWGYEVIFTSYTDNGIEIVQDDTVLYEKHCNMPEKLYHIFRRYFLFYHVYKYLKGNRTFQIGYLRYYFFDSFFLRVLKELKKGGSIVIVEAHGWPIKVMEHFQPSRLIPYFADILYRKKCSKYIDYVAAISSEKNIWGCKTIQMDNGIDCSKISVQNKIKDKNWDIRFISVSNEYQYHGYAKLIKSLHTYQKQGGTQKIQIVFVGQFLEATKKLVQELHMEEYVVFTGKKSGDELEKLYNQADIGIGALASRFGASHGSSIKTKEYFAKGLPFVTAWKEYSIEDGYPYVLYLDPFQEEINMKDIISFYDTIKDDVAMSRRMREFAEKNYTWECQLNKIFSIVESELRKNHL